MADAPSGGSGWGALEIVLAAVLAIGLLATLSGHTIGIAPASSSTATVHKTSAKAVSTAPISTTPACGIIVSQPASHEQIGAQVTVEGVIEPCANSLVAPDTLTAYVVDNDGNVISPYTTMTVDKSFFGDASFDSVIPLQGVAQSPKAELVITSSVTNEGTTLSASVPLVLLPGPTTTTNLDNTGSYNTF